MRFSILFLFWIGFCACVSKPPVQTQPTPVLVETPDPIVLKIGNSGLTFKELKVEWDTFAYVDSLNPRQNFDLYLFEKKLEQEARAQGYFERSAIKDEFKSFQNNLSTSYLVDSSIVYKLVDETYAWLKTEVRASHILIPVPELADSSTAAMGYNKIWEIRKRAVEGEDFANLARENSADFKTAQQGGDLGYFGALFGLYPITKAAYETAVGEISPIVRTKSGFHIIKVADKRPTLGERKFAHILVKTNKGDTQEQLQASRKLIDSAYAKLQAAVPFETVAAQFSDDVTSKQKGGVIPVFYGIGKLDEKTEEELFKLNEIGQTSQPFLSGYGWSILKLLDKRSLGGYEELKPTLIEKCVTDTRGEIVKAASMNRLKNIAHFEENKSVIEECIAKLDTNILIRKWKYNTQDQILKKAICKLGDRQLFVQDYLNFVQESQNYTRLPSGSAMASINQFFYQNFVERNLKDYAVLYFSENTPEFKGILGSYQRGTLKDYLYNEKVYIPSADSLRHQEYYLANKAKFILPESQKSLLVETIDAKVLDQFLKSVEGPAPYRLKRGMNPLNFEKHSVVRINDHLKILLGLVQILKNNRNLIVEIGGHGEIGESDTLSAARLNLVRRFLVDNDIPLTRIIEKDYLKTKPAKEFGKSARVTIEFWSNSKTDLAKTINQAAGNKVITVWDKTFFKGQNPYIDAYFGKLGENRWTQADKVLFCQTTEVMPSRPKTLKECRGQVYAEYQDLLLKQFEENINQKYQVEVSEETINQLINTEWKQ